MTNLTRRGTLAGLAGTIALPSVLSAATGILTPAQTAGPYYPPIAQRFNDTDWDLVRVAGVVQNAGGVILHLSGQARDVAGNPVSGRTLEIWQCDVNGRYLHHNDTAQHAKRDPAFQGYGAVRTDADGGFVLRTIVPVSYPGRTPHIHLRIERPTGGYLITQLYIAGDTRNSRDRLFRSLGEDGQQAVSMRFAKRGDGSLDARVFLVI